jgi:putative heme iron utilization protein
VAESGVGGEQDAAAAEMPAGRAVRLLLRGARAGFLATQADGQPFAALVTPAVAPDLSILLLLSSLSEHTRQLQAEPRCALMVHGHTAGANPQTAPRATITGLAERFDDAAARARWLAIHPYGALYAGFGDFAVWRIVPRGAQFVGGFARAARPRLAELLPTADAVASVAAAEEEIIVHCNNDHAEAVRVIVAAVHGAANWQMVCVDIDGFDAADGERVVRIDWPGPVDGPDGVRAALIRLARIARGT